MFDTTNSEDLSVTVLLSKERVQLAPSKADARRLVESGGIYVNNRRVNDPKARITRKDAIEGRLLLLRKGQKQNHVVRLT